MNAVEIEEAVSKLAEAPFNADTFPYDFLQAFGVNDAGIRKLRSGDGNRSDLPGGVLQRNKNNIHLLTCPLGEVGATMDALRASPATAKQKARFILATDGQAIQAERFEDGEVLACAFKELPDRFAYFLSLAGISTVKRIDENAFDIRATGRLNKLYVELLKENPDWDTEARRQDLNHFFARLIFCFFAEDTKIFPEQLFTATVEQMTVRDGSNTHEVLAKLFEAMNTPREKRAEAKHLPASALKFPYVNGNLFGGSIDTPKFNQAARNYLLFVGKLDWKKINPDIFGSMIQAVADDEERGALGMHYTSVPNILKALNPLFLDDLRAKLEEAGDGKTPGSARKLLNLRNRLARIRVFDPACGSGNFLVIAYKEMRQIEAIINERRGERDDKSVIPISNFRGIELRSFPAEIARLALIIAEFQCDVLYRNELLARQDFLPLDTANWITCGNALRLDWLSICPPTGTGVKVTGDDLFNTPLDQSEIDFENEGGETYVCGNPPYQGSVNQKDEQKEDLKLVFNGIVSSYKDLDYVSAWFVRAAQYLSRVTGSAGLVATNSVCQGEQVAMLWPYIFGQGLAIIFAHTSFPWSNNASHNAGVTCVVIGIGRKGEKAIYNGDLKRKVSSISPYLVEGATVVVTKRSEPLSKLPRMMTGNLPSDGGHLIMSFEERLGLLASAPGTSRFVKRFIGSRELINGGDRWCFWITDEQVGNALKFDDIAHRLKKVVLARRASRGDQAKAGVSTPHRFVFAPHRPGLAIAIPKVSSSRREFIPCALTNDDTIVSDLARVIYDAAVWNLAIIASRLHLVWIATVCGKLKTDFRYSNTLGWNTFPVPTLTEQNEADLTRCAEEILLGREAHFPATIAEMYDPEAMDTKYRDLRAAHERNDETLERIYIGRRFRNDTERLEKLFEMYTEMTAKEGLAGKSGGTKRKGVGA